MVFRAQLIRGTTDLFMAIYDWPKGPVIPGPDHYCEALYTAPDFFVWRADTFEVRVRNPELRGTDGDGLFLPGRADMFNEQFLLTKVNGLPPEYIDAWIERFQIAHLELNGYQCKVIDLRQDIGDNLAMETVG